MTRARTPSRQTLEAKEDSQLPWPEGEGHAPCGVPGHIWESAHTAVAAPRGKDKDGLAQDTCVSPRGPDSPHQDALGAADEADQHQQADGDIKQQQAQVAQPPAGDTARGVGQARRLGLRLAELGQTSWGPAGPTGSPGIHALAWVLGAHGPWGTAATVATEGSVPPAHKSSGTGCWEPSGPPWRVNLDPGAGETSRREGTAHLYQS